MSKTTATKSTPNTVVAEVVEVVEVVTAPVVEENEATATKIVGSVEIAAKMTKSEMFRQMYDSGMTIGQIAKETESHYSFVYGVISASREIVKATGNSKSDEIRKMYIAGMTPGEIARTLNSNYSFVFSVCKKMKVEVK